MFVAYVDHNAIYSSLSLKSDMLNCNTIIKATNVKPFPQCDKIYHTTKTSNAQSCDFEQTNEILRSKRQRRETSFENDSCTFINDNEHLFNSKAIYSFDTMFWKEVIIN